MIAEHTTFSSLTAGNHKLYRAVMLEFMRAKGLAQIIRNEGVEGILVERWEWDGANRVILPDPR